MSVKKPTPKHKEKAAHAHEAAPKHKLATTEKQATEKQAANDAPAMDARSNKDRRDNDRRQSDAPVAVERRTGERRSKVTRRRQIDPTTCERDYSPEEVEFMTALNDYKRRSGRMFPTCSEILEVFKGLGYERRLETSVHVLAVEPAAVAAVPTEQAV